VPTSLSVCALSTLNATLTAAVPLCVCAAGKNDELRQTVSLKEEALTRAKGDKLRADSTASMPCCMQDDGHSLRTLSAMPLSLSDTHRCCCC